MEDKFYNKAKELILHYYNIVYPYVGSDYMTGTETPSYKFEQAKEEALFLVQNLLDGTSSTLDINDHIKLQRCIDSITFENCTFLPDVDYTKK